MSSAETAQITTPGSSLEIRGYGFIAVAATLAWLTVTSILLLRLCLAWHSLGGLRRRADCAESWEIETCRVLAADVGVAAPEVLRSPYLPSPCVGRSMATGGVAA